MINASLKEAVFRLLPRVKAPAQYSGGELNSVVKDHRRVRGRMCLCFPDAYSIGTSHHGLQVLYTLMNDDPQWACERAFAPWGDFEAVLRKAGLPLYGLETFTPLRDFDLLGFSLQYEVCYTNILTMLDLGGLGVEHGGSGLGHEESVLAINADDRAYAKPPQMQDVCHNTHRRPNNRQPVAQANVYELAHILQTI